MVEAIRGCSGLRVLLAIDGRLREAFTVSIGTSRFSANNSSALACWIPPPRRCINGAASATHLAFPSGVDVSF